MRRIYAWLHMSQAARFEREPTNPGDPLALLVLEAKGCRKVGYLPKGVASKVLFYIPAKCSGVVLPALLDYQA